MKFNERYKLRVPLGESDLGAVWDALDNQEDRGVVIVMLEDDAPEALVSFFQKTYEKLRGLKAPGIVEVLDLGITEDGAPYASVERLEGETLAERLEGGDLDFTIGNVVDWVATALEGLDAAHGAGIVHGDIDPSCLFLHTDAEGETHPKLISWGLNRARARAAFHTPDPADSEALLRSIAFTAPEQSEGRREPVPGDDLYGIGAILYDALTGELPRHGRDITTLRAAIQAGPVVPANKVRTEITGTLAATIDRALHQDVKRRPQTAQVLLRGLKSSLGFSSRVIALPPRGGRRSLEPSEFLAAAASSGAAKKAFQVPTPGGPKRAQHVVGAPLTKKASKRSAAVTGTLVGVGSPAKSPVPVPTPKGALPSPKASKGAAAFGPETTNELSTEGAEAIHEERVKAGKVPPASPPPKSASARSVRPPPPTPAAKTPATPKGGSREATSRLSLSDVEVVQTNKSVPPPVPDDDKVTAPVVVPKIVTAGVPQVTGDAAPEPPGSDSTEEEGTEDASSEDASSEDASSEDASSEDASSEDEASDADDPGRPSAAELDAAAEALNPSDALWPEGGGADADADADSDDDAFVAKAALPAWVPPQPDRRRLIGGAVLAAVVLGVIIVATTGGDEVADGGSVAGPPGDVEVVDRSLEDDLSAGAEDLGAQPGEADAGEADDGEADAGEADAGEADAGAAVAIITLSGIPEGAAVSLDDVPVELDAGAFTVEATETERSLAVSAEGFEPFTQVFVAEGDAEIAVTMIPLPAAAPATTRPATAMARTPRAGMTTRGMGRRTMANMRPRVIADPGF